MGRIIDLFGEVAAEAEEGTEGLLLGADSWERLREDWRDEDIEDALSLVHESLLQSELVESADSLSSRLVEVLGELGERAAFERLVAGEGRLSLETVGQLARRLARLEDVLEVFRDDAPPDRRGFDALRRHLMDVGIEDEMGRRDEAAPPESEDE